MKKVLPILPLVLLCASSACLDRAVRTELEKDRAQAKLEEPGNSGWN